MPLILTTESLGGRNGLTVDIGITWQLINSEARSQRACMERTSLVLVVHNLYHHYSLPLLKSIIDPLRGKVRLL